MKKIFIIVLVLVALLMYAFAMDRGVVDAPQNGGSNTNNETVGANERQVEGRVVSVNTDQVPVDGPAIISILQDDGTQATVAVRSMGINLCPAQANIADPYQIESGDRVEVRGQVDSGNMIVPCESSEHYLRVIGQ